MHAALIDLVYHSILANKNRGWLAYNQQEKREKETRSPLFRIATFLQTSETIFDIHVKNISIEMKLTVEPIFLGVEGVRVLCGLNRF